MFKFDYKILKYLQSGGGMIPDIVFKNDYLTIKEIDGQQGKDLCFCSKNKEYLTSLNDYLYDAYNITAKNINKDTNIPYKKTIWQFQDGNFCIKLRPDEYLNFSQSIETNKYNILAKFIETQFNTIYNEKKKQEVTKQKYFEQLLEEIKEFTYKFPQILKNIKKLWDYFYDNVILKSDNEKIFRYIELFWISFIFYLFIIPYNKTKKIIATTDEQAEIIYLIELKKSLAASDVESQIVFDLSEARLQKACQYVKKYGGILIEINDD